MREMTSREGNRFRKGHTEMGTDSRNDPEMTWRDDTGMTR